MKYYSFLLAFLLLMGLPFIAQSQQQSTNKNTINIFLDCDRCDRSYIRQEISYVNYVRDKEDADVHILITRQRTGSGGTEYSLRYIGRKEFEDRDDNLTYTSPKSDTEDEERKGLVRTIKIGLMSYLVQKEVVTDLNISYEEETEVQSSAESDRWNYWVFEIDGRSFFNGEERRKEFFISLGASADRITKNWKIETNYNFDFNRRTFTRTDSGGNESTNEFTSQGQRFNGSVVKSLNDHWSLGVLTEASSSTRNNIALSVGGSPAIEYNIFPYEEYNEHRISFMYVMSATYFDYEEITIFNERSEFLVRPQLRGRMDFTQPWGEVEGRINASTFLHDVTKNRVDLNLEIDFRIFRGLSLSLDGRYSLINDQLSIPKGDITDAEQLLNLREQATSYSYRGSIGIEYSFGSIYNNVVNPRF